MSIRALLFSLLLTTRGCTTTIIPPSQPAHPTAVVVTDYGRHSSLLLPDPHGGLTEYAFGDWDWFARERTNPIVAIHAIIHSPQSTLGRRWIDASADSPTLNQIVGALRTEEIIVDRDRVAALQERLDREFIDHLYSLTFNAHGRLFFVKSDETYDGLHDCNHATADWLKELGACIKGLPILSHFRVAAFRPAG